MGMDISGGAGGAACSRREVVARVIASSLKLGTASIREPAGSCGFAGLPAGISGIETSDDVVQPIKRDKQKHGTTKMGKNFMGNED